MVAIAYGVARAAVSASASKPAGSAAKGFFARLLDAMVEARAKQVAQEIARYRYIAREWPHDTFAVKGEELPFGR